MSSEALVYTVPGVTCEHCRTAIVDEVGAVAGVESVTVDLDAKLVSVLGRKLSDADVRAAIDEAGYDVLDVAP
jgi:copper chaperone CopZ